MPDRQTSHESEVKLCPVCGARERRSTTIDYRTQIRLDRRMVDVHVPSLPIEQCGACGEEFFGTAADRLIDESLRGQAGLLTARQLDSAREAVGVETQQEFAELIGVAPETLSRWMKGHVIQSRLADTMLRVFFGVPESRAFLQALRSQRLVTSRIVVPDPVVTAPRSLRWVEEPHQARSSPLEGRSVLNDLAA